MEFKKIKSPYSNVDELTKAPMDYEFRQMDEYRLAHASGLLQ